MAKNFYETFPSSWQEVIQKHVPAEHLERMESVLQRDRCSGWVFPPPEQVFTALWLTPLETVRAVILGQDPYHSLGQAEGLAFSVPAGVEPPPSLKNILKEWSQDLKREMPLQGSLRPWARQGVLLLNTLLTVREGQPLSHRDLGWERVTQAIVQELLESKNPCVFILWGASAKKAIQPLPQNHPHLILSAPHPSPLSSHRGFFGSRPFSQASAFLEQSGRGALTWEF